MSLTYQSQRKKTSIYILSGILIALFLFISFPGDRSEADDAIRYAYHVTHTNYANLFYSRYVLFMPFFKWIYDALHSLSPKVDGYLMMCTVSVICTAITIVNCYKILRSFFSLDNTTALFTCGMLLFSYGFWRYAVEAEIYALESMLNIFVLLYVLTAVNNKNILPALVGGIFAGFAILIYKPDFIPVAFSLPLIFLFKKQFKSFILFEVVAGIITLAGYYFAYLHAAQYGEGFIAFASSGLSNSTGNRLMGLFVFIGNILSTNFLFGVSWIIPFIKHNFTFASIAEEMFAAKKNGIFNYVALFTMILAAFSILYFFIKAFTAKCKITWRAQHTILLVWFVLYTGMVFYFDPNSPEPLVMTLVPFWLIIGSTLAPAYQQTKHLLPLSFIVGIVFLHNLIGGYKVYHSKDSYIARQSEWLIKNAQPEDIVLSPGQFSGLIWYLRYYSNTNVFWRDEDFNTWLPKINDAVAKGHRIYLIQDVGEALKMKKNNTATIAIESFIKDNALKLQPVSATDKYAANVYELIKPSAQTALLP